jgi:hypothetical protein
MSAPKCDADRTSIPDAASARSIPDKIFGIRQRSCQPVCEPEQGQMMFVEQLQKCGFPASSRCFDQIHACLNSITARGGKESHQWTYFGD